MELLLLFAFMMGRAHADLLPLPRSIESGGCHEKSARIEYTDHTKSDFPLHGGMKCTDFKISANHRYAGWKEEGTIIQDTSPPQTFHDATLFVVMKGKLIRVANLRYINHWDFDSDGGRVFFETAFEHGPSNYDLFNLQTQKSIESCRDPDFSKCPQIQTWKRGTSFSKDP